VSIAILVAPACPAKPRMGEHHLLGATRILYRNVTCYAGFDSNRITAGDFRLIASVPETTCIRQRSVANARGPTPK